MVPNDSPATTASVPAVTNALPQRRTSLLTVLILALLGSAAAAVLTDRISPVFLVPEEFHLPDLGPTPEQVAALQAQQLIVDRKNAMLELACLGAIVAGAIAIGECLARRHFVPFLIAVPLGAVAGCVAGVIASVTYTALDVRTVASVTETVKFQVVLLGVLGFGVGTALGLATGSFRTAVTCGLAALAAGVLMGFLYPVVVSFALPSANIAAMLPQGLINRLVWCAFAAASVTGWKIEAGGKEAGGGRKRG